MDSKRDKINKGLSTTNAVIIIIGMVIGSGIFFKPSIVVNNAGSNMGGILAWVIGGVITMTAGLTLGEIASAIPKSGGVFVYLKELYGELISFLFGWVQSVIYMPGAIAALVIVFATQVSSFIPLTHNGQLMVAIGVVILITIINLVSTTLGAKFQIVATIIKLIPIVAVIGLGYIKGTANTTIVTTSNVTGGAGIGAAILGTLWAYDGWVNISNIAGDFKKPSKDLPKSIILGIVGIMVVYIAFNGALMKVLPFETLRASATPAHDAAVAIFGNVGSNIIAAGILISVLAAANGYFMTGIKVPYVMGQEKLIPFSKSFSSVSPKFKTPVTAILFQGLLSIIYVATGSFNTLTDLIMFVIWVFFLLALVGIFVLRKKHKGLTTEYKVPLYPVVPIIAILGSAFIIVNTLINNMLYGVIGVVITLLGIPVYYYMKRDKSNENK